jgi:hypothetical protein
MSWSESKGAESQRHARRWSAVPSGIRIEKDDGMVLQDAWNADGAWI